MKKNLENFENNKEEGLKLLFIIDKLNEGLHLEEVHGCILLRTTVSNIIYYQQIGRAIDAGSNEQRVILDLVSNFNSLKSFNLKKELEEKVRERQEGKFSDCSDEFEIDKFDVIDCIQECVDVFNNIDLEIIADRRKWTEYEKSILIQFYPIIGPKVKEKIPNRTKESIKNMAYDLGLIFQNSWTDEEYSILKTNYPIIGIKVRELLVNKTDDSIVYMAKKLGIKNRNIDYWKKDEDDILKMFYPIEGRRVYKRLTNRTMQQCQTRAKKLGLKSNNKNRFTNEEVQILKEFYPKEGRNVYKRLKDRTAAACANYCKIHGIRRQFANNVG